MNELCHRLGTSYSKIPEILAEKSPRYAKKISSSRSKIYRCASEEYDLRDYDLIAAFEDALPGSARVAEHPLWRILGDDVNSNSLTLAAQQLRPSLYVSLVNFNADDDAFEFKTPSTPHRNKKFYEALNEPPFHEAPNLDCLVGLIIYAKICARFKNRYTLDASFIARLNIQNMLLNLALQPRFFPPMKSLYRLINERFVESISSDVNETFKDPKIKITFERCIFRTPNELKREFDQLTDVTQPYPIQTMTYRE
ncbi:hypothetical protein [Marinagarivorans cellulosilyticus]|uniref:hypothetical protein n=1 Tax=Marinagarivorans cellulosilyticus TaxID=2721545 RepID=UPI001F34EB51|nr:hypothetical protein [Marinagarivorans cellulosilyticus]